MPTAVHDFNALTEHIEGLDPSQIGPEIGDIVARGSETSPLGRIITKYDGELDAENPLTDLLETVETAIGRAPASSVKASLGEKAVGALAGALGSSVDLRPRSGNTVRSLADQAVRFAGFIEDPLDRAFSLVDIGKHVIRPATLDEAWHARSSGEHEDPEFTSLFVTNKGYFDQAAETAALITDPASRSRALSWIAGGAASNLAATGRHGMTASPEEARAITKQPVELFEAAGEAVDAIEDAPTRYRQRILNAKGMAAAAAAVAETDISTAWSLAVMAAREIDTVVRDYRDGKAGELMPAEACYQLTDYGQELAAVIEDKYAHAPGSTSEARDLLAGRVFAIFDQARTQAQAVEHETKAPGKPQTRTMSNVPSNNATRSAAHLVASNPDVAKKVLEAGFDIALSEDADRGRHSDSRTAVLEAISEIAHDQAPGLRFELFALAHSLERAQLDKGGVSHALDVNARRWLQTVRGYDKITLNKDVPGGRELVEFAIQTASKGENWISHLKSMASALDAYPDLRQQAVEAYEHLSEQQRQTREPKTQTARIAQELLRQM